MNPHQKDLIKATIPILKSNGEDLTDYFYIRMFRHHPELKNTFNMGNQANGKQKSALANAVLAYAENIEDPSVLLNILKGIGTKHRSLNIQPEQYKIVGTQLIASIAEVLGEAATPEILEAWTVAYYQLAQIMIDIEKELYKENSSKSGSWNGWRKFTIKRIVEESSEVKSFYLYPEDAMEITDFHPGQFISIRVFVPELGILQPRQYSLSHTFHPEYYRISVKKENEIDSNPSGTVSNIMHSKSEGDSIEVSAPAGLFHMEKNAENPLVLISGGVGFTPMLSMLEANSNAMQNKKVVWIHGCRNESVHAFKNQISALKEEVKWLQTFTFYDTIDHQDDAANHAIKGRVDLNLCKESILLEEAKYYICGPEMFIKAQYDALINLNVNPENVFYEEFGPQVIHLN